jgi:hypothetical protein
MPACSRRRHAIMSGIPTPRQPFWKVPIHRRDVGGTRHADIRRIAVANIRDHLPMRMPADLTVAHRLSIDNQSAGRVRGNSVPTRPLVGSDVDVSAGRNRIPRVVCP